jgi:hypothetical protein
MRSVDEKGLIDLCLHLGSLIGEDVLELATADAPRVLAPAAARISLIGSPDAQRRFRA